MDPDGRAVTNPGCTHCGGDGSQYGRNGIDEEDDPEIVDAGVPMACPGGLGGDGTGICGTSDPHSTRKNLQEENRVLREQLSADSFHGFAAATRVKLEQSVAPRFLVCEFFI